MYSKVLRMNDSSLIEKARAYYYTATGESISDNQILIKALEALIEKYKTPSLTAMVKKILGDKY